MSPTTSSEQIGVKKSGGKLYHFLDFLLGPIVFFYSWVKKGAFLRRIPKTCFSEGPAGADPHSKGPRHQEGGQGSP